MQFIQHHLYSLFNLICSVNVCDRNYFLWNILTDGAKVSLPSQLCGTPVLVISGRIPLLSVSLEGTDNKTRSNDCLWGAMQTVCVITDYIFRSHNIFTNVSTQQMCNGMTFLHNVTNVHTLLTKSEMFRHAQSVSEMTWHFRAISEMVWRFHEMIWHFHTISEMIWHFQWMFEIVWYFHTVSKVVWTSIQYPNSLTLTYNI